MGLSLCRHGLSTFGGKAYLSDCHDSTSSSASNFPLCFVPQNGQRISISFSSPINFSRSFSGPKKLTSPQAHWGHSALTSYLLLDIFSSFLQPFGLTNLYLLQSVVDFSPPSYKLIQNFLATPFWPLLPKVLSEVKCKNCNCLRAIARVLQFCEASLVLSIMAKQTKEKSFETASKHHFFILVVALMVLASSLISSRSLTIIAHPYQ